MHEEKLKQREANFVGQLHFIWQVILLAGTAWYGTFVLSRSELKGGTKVTHTTV